MEELANDDNLVASFFGADHVLEGQALMLASNATSSSSSNDDSN